MPTRTDDSAASSPSERGGSGATRVGTGILLSRIAGLLRERALGHYFGASIHADMWRAALRLPNVLQNLLGEGTLSASFIPIYAGMEEADRKEAARRFAGAVFGLLFIAAGTLALLGIALAPVLVAILVPGFGADEKARMVELVRILLPMTGVLVLSAWSLGVLNTHRRFFLPYVAPVAWNAAILLALVGGGRILGWDGDELLRLTAWGALVGGILQFGVQLPSALRLLGGLRPSISRKVDGVRDAIRAFVPVLLARGVVNVGGYLDIVVASLLATGAIMVLGSAQTFYLLPISLFGMAVAASELPELSRRRAAGAMPGSAPGAYGGAGAAAASGAVDGPSAESDTPAALAGSIGKGVGRIAFFLVPSAAVYIALGDVVVAALYQTGAFGPLEVRLTWAVLAAYAVGMGASATSRLLSSAFYALGNTRTPAWLAGLRVVLAFGIGVALMFPFDRIEVGGGLFYGAVGLAIGSSVGAWVEFLLLRAKLARVIGPYGPVPGTVPRLVASALVAVAIGAGLRRLLLVIAPTPHPIPAAALILGATGVAYLVGVRVLGLDIPLPPRFARLLGRRER